jgi:hypothetical protein
MLGLIVEFLGGALNAVIGVVSNRFLRGSSVKLFSDEESVVDCDVRIMQIFTTQGEELIFWPRVKILNKAIAASALPVRFSNLRLSDISAGLGTISLGQVYVELQVIKPPGTLLTFSVLVQESLPKPLMGFCVPTCRKRPQGSRTCRGNRTTDPRFAAVELLSWLGNPNSTASYYIAK